MRILLVRLRLVGDVVFTTPIIRALRRHYPDGYLAYVVEELAAPIVAHNRHLDDVLVLRHSRGLTRLRDDLALARQLRAARFDVAIDLHGGPRSGWLTRASGAPMRVGYDVAGRAWMYTHAVHRSRDLTPRHSVVNQWDLLAAVDPALAVAPDPDRDRVEMVAGEAADLRVTERLARLGLSAAQQLAVIHVSAGNPFRRWPEASFVALIVGLTAGRPDRHVLITAGPSDREAERRVVQAARAGAGTAGARIHEMDDLPLADLRALLGHAAVFVGGDSGPLHVAATTDVPIVAVFGPSLPERSAPWRPRAIPTAAVDVGALPCRPCHQRVCEPGDFRCLTRISAAEVLTTTERLLERSA